MRKNNVTRTFGSALLIAPLLVACGTDGAGGGNTSGSGMLPTDCKPGQALTTNSSGNLICKDLPAGAGGLPTCAANQAFTSNGKNLNCVERATGTQDDPAKVMQINQIGTDLVDIEKKIQMLDQTRQAGVKTYVGSTAAKYNGQLGAGAADSSLKIAADKCAAEFGAGAQMCTMLDLYYSAATGKLTTAMTITQAQRAWIYFPAWNTPAGLPGGAAREPLAGMSDTCGSYTYPTGDLAWAGIAFSWENAMTGRKALKFFGGTAARCSDNLAIACCK